jgi:hypothetical protein
MAKLDAAMNNPQVSAKNELSEIRHDTEPPRSTTQRSVAG